MKRYIRSASEYAPGWSKRYDKELQQTYYVLAIPRRSAVVAEFNDDGDYGYIARVVCMDTGSKKSKTFHGKGSSFEAMDWCEKILYQKPVKSSTEPTRWTDYLSEEVRARLANCNSRKEDIADLVNAKWRKMKEQGKDKQGFTKEDALVSVLDLLDSNSCNYDLTREEYQDLKFDH